MQALAVFLRHPYTRRAAQIAIGVVFLISGLAKIGDLQSFALEVHNFRMLPVWSENLAAMTLPWVELIAALSLLLAIRPRAGSVVAAALMAVFLVAVGVAQARGLDITCGCFGTADGTRVGWIKLGENLVLFGLSALGYLRGQAVS
jgi:uncharacterized membrane protein YphA (DoxX/SURF4 family)